MKTLSALLLSLSVSAMLGAACLPGGQSPSMAPDYRFRTGEWELRIWYSHKGTRSEGQYGELYRSGKEICPQPGLETLQTPLGKLRFYRSKFFWGLHGWNYADPDKVPPPSWDRKRTAGPSTERNTSQPVPSDADELWKSFEKTELKNVKGYMSH